MGRIRVGLSGWSYRGWHGSFYPSGMPRKRELEHAAETFDTLEVNGSFYGLLKPETYADWHARTPRGFVFALKGSRFITHNKKLRDCETPLANFFASGVLRLDRKLGPFVWQLSKRLDFDADRLAEFLRLLPHDTHEAARLARKHDARVAGRSWTRPGTKRRIRYALEVRNETYRVAELSSMLRRAGVALAVSDAADWPRIEEVTAGFVYVRLHGSRATYGSRYTDAELDAWAERLWTWSRGGEPPDADRITPRPPPRRTGRDVYVYFDNDRHAHAPADAARLAARLAERSARENGSRAVAASLGRSAMRSSGTMVDRMSGGRRRHSRTGGNA